MPHAHVYLTKIIVIKILLFTYIRIQHSAARKLRSMHAHILRTLILSGIATTTDSVRNKLRRSSANQTQKYSDSSVQVRGKRVEYTIESKNFTFAFILRDSIENDRRTPR